MKKICLILMLSILSVGCSGDPRELVIPQDTSEIDQFSEKVKSLNQEERYLLNYYIRNEHYQRPIPIGKTVKEAIDETRKYLIEEDKYYPPE